jgi:hypothetical protein
MVAAERLQTNTRTDSFRQHRARKKKGSTSWSLVSRWVNQPLRKAFPVLSFQGHREKKIMGPVFRAVKERKQCFTAAMIALVAQLG